VTFGALPAKGCPDINVPVRQAPAVSRTGDPLRGLEPQPTCILTALSAPVATERTVRDDLEGVPGGADETMTAGDPEISIPGKPATMDASDPA
jgi:hypothetical protein